MAKTLAIPKVKECRYCHRLFEREDLSLRQICTECGVKRARRWHELQQEAHEKFKQEFPD